MIQLQDKQITSDRYPIYFNSCKRTKYFFESHKYIEFVSNITTWCWNKHPRSHNFQNSVPKISFLLIPAWNILKLTKIPRMSQLPVEHPWPPHISYFLNSHTWYNFTKRCLVLSYQNYLTFVLMKSSKPKEQILIILLG